MSAEVHSRVSDDQSDVGCSRTETSEELVGGRRTDWISKAETQGD